MIIDEKNVWTIFRCNDYYRGDDIISAVCARDNKNTQPIKSLEDKNLKVIIRPYEEGE